MTGEFGLQYTRNGACLILGNKQGRCYCPYFTGKKMRKRSTIAHIVHTAKSVVVMALEPRTRLSSEISFHLLSLTHTHSNSKCFKYALIDQLNFLPSEVLAKASFRESI